MTYEVVKIYSATEIETMPTRWRRRKNAEQAAKDLNAAERHRGGGLSAAITGVGPAKWQATSTQVVEALLVRAQSLLSDTTENDKPEPHTVCDDQA